MCELFYEQFLTITNDKFTTFYSRKDKWDFFFFQIYYRRESKLFDYYNEANLYISMSTGLMN